MSKLHIFYLIVFYPVSRKKRSQSIKSTRSHGSMATVRAEEEPPKERSVDDIIASLKAQQEQGSVAFPRNSLFTLRT